MSHNDRPRRGFGGLHGPFGRNGSGRSSDLRLHRFRTSTERPVAADPSRCFSDKFDIRYAINKVERITRRFVYVFLAQYTHDIELTDGDIPENKASEGVRSRESKFACGGVLERYLLTG